MLLRRELYAGYNDKSYRKVFLTDRLRSTHMHILGRTGTGKTSHIEHMIKDDLVKRKGLCVIDMLGNLYPKLLDYCVNRNMADRVILFDPSEEVYCPGLNYLDTFGVLDPSVVVEKVMEGILRIYKQHNEAAKPRWETYGPLTFTPLVNQNMTLLEILPLVAPHIAGFRQRLLEQTNDFQLREGWKLFNSLKKVEDRFNLIEVVYNRGMRFWATDAIRRIVGQPRNFVDWATAMDEGKVILCNLGASTRVSRKFADMLGVIILHQIIETAQLRRGGQQSPFYVYIDEFGRIICKDFEFALDSLRQFGVSFILANQRLGQLRRDIESEDVYSAVMANALCKVVFNVWHEDAEVMAKEMFAQQIHGDDVKYQGKHTMLIPHQELVELESHSATATSGSSSGLDGSSYTTGIVYDSNYERRSHSQTSGWSSASHSQTTSESDSHAVQQSFKTEYDRETEDDTPVFYSIEEKVNHYARLVMAQGQRECKLLIPGRRPISIRTPFVRDRRVRSERLSAFKEKVYEKNKFLTATQVDLLIDERMRRNLGEDYSGLMQKVEARELLEDDRWE